MTTAFRPLVMLAFFVGLPAAWIYYGPLPDDAQLVVDRFVAAAKETVGWDKVVVARAVPASQSAPTFTPNQPTSFKVGASPAPLGQVVGDDPTSTGCAVASPVATVLGPVGAGELVATSAAPSAQLAAAVEPLLARLRAWGVAKYALEPWGSGHSLYRFHCEMPLAADAELTQQFEAVADDPQATIEQVVAEVATWQLARQDNALLR